MNNRYICRGKRKDNGKCVTGYYVFKRKRSGVFGQVISELDFDRHLIIDLWGNSHEVIPETVVRCTGLKDKNGKLIFEGDILKLGTGKTRFVFYGVSSFRHTAYNEYAKEFDFKDKGYQVIGNTHDNPELLEVKE